MGMKNPEAIASGFCLILFGVACGLTTVVLGMSGAVAITARLFLTAHLGAGHGAMIHVLNTSYILFLW